MVATNSDWLRNETDRQADEIRKLRHDLALERFRRLTLEIESAIAANDGVTWARACAERMQLGLEAHEVEGMWPKREAL